MTLVDPENPPKPPDEPAERPRRRRRDHGLLGLLPDWALASLLLLVTAVAGAAINELRGNVSSELKSTASFQRHLENRVYTIEAEARARAADLQQLREETKQNREEMRQWRQLQAQSNEEMAKHVIALNGSVARLTSQIDVFGAELRAQRRD